MGSWAPSDVMNGSISSASKGRFTSPQPPQHSCTGECVSFQNLAYKTKKQRTSVVIHLSENKASVRQFWVGYERVKPSSVLISAWDRHRSLHTLRDIEGNCDVVEALIVVESDIRRHFVSRFLQPLEARLAVSRTICDKTN